MIALRKKKLLLIVLAVILVAAGAAAAAWFLLREAPMENLEQVQPPEGAQLLIFPMNSGLITAGYRNQNYLEKNGYPHYGLDITGTRVGTADIVSPGQGVVLGTEWCDNSLGYIAVIRHDNVYVPQTGQTLPLVGRYYHMTALMIAEGDTVYAGQTIGTIDTRHEWHNHIHLELDADVDYPFHTPQVAETSSELLYRYPANGDGFLDPVWVLAMGNGQRVTVHPGSRSCTEKDEPRFAHM